MWLTPDCVAGAAEMVALEAKVVTVFVNFGCCCGVEEVRALLAVESAK